VSGADRAVSTAVDAVLALLLVSAATAVLVTFAGTDDPDHDPMEARYTTETVASSTTNTTYHPERALGAYHGGDVYDETGYDRRDLRRVTHGPILAQIADVAVTNVAFDPAELRDEPGTGRLSDAAHEYRGEVHGTLQTQLVNASFRTHVAAVWEPIEGGPIMGEAEVGERPPAREDVSATTVTVPSGFPSARTAAAEAVQEPDDFDVLARVVAEEVIEGYFPALPSQRALEGGGVDRDRTVYRYENMAAVLGLDADATETLQGHLAPETANATAANELLIAALSAQLEAYLTPDGPPKNGPLGDAYRAAAAVSTGEVTVTVRTWT